MSRCTYCGAENPEDARFCGSCGRTGQNAPHTEQGKPLEVEEPGDASQRPANGDRITNDEGQKMAQGDFVLPLGPAHGALSGAQVPMLQGTPQLGQVPTVQGVPTTPQPAGNAAPSPASNAPATSASQAAHAAHVSPHASGASAAHAQHTGTTAQGQAGHNQQGHGAGQNHAREQVRHNQQTHSAAQNTAAHAAVKGGVSVVTKIIATIIVIAVIVAGGAGAFAIARQHQSSSHTAPSVSKHNSGTASSSGTVNSTKAGPNTFILTGAVNGTLSKVNITTCGDSPQIPAYSLDLSGTLNNDPYSLILDIPNNNSQTGNNDLTGTFVFPNSSSYGAQISTGTQVWGGTDKDVHGKVIINSDNVSGTISDLTFPRADGTPGQIILNGNWLCPAAPNGQSTPSAPPVVTNNVFTISGAINGTLTLTAFLTCGMTPSGSAVGGLATGTLNGQTYHLNFLFPHYHGPGTYTDPSPPGNVTMNFNDGSHTWSTNGSDAQGSATVNSDNNSGSFSLFTVPGINGESGTHVTIDGSWSCQ